MPVGLRLLFGAEAFAPAPAYLSAISGAAWFFISLLSHFGANMLVQCRRCRGGVGGRGLLQSVAVQHPFEAAVVDIEETGRLHLLAAGGRQSLPDGVAFHLLQGLCLASALRGAGVAGGGDEFSQLI